MKSPTICKSECNTWYVIAINEAGDYCVFYEGYRRKDCKTWLDARIAD